MQERLALEGLPQRVSRLLTAVFDRDARVFAWTVRRFVEQAFMGSDIARTPRERAEHLIASIEATLSTAEQGIDATKAAIVALKARDGLDPKDLRVCVTKVEAAAKALDEVEGAARELDRVLQDEWSRDEIKGAAVRVSSALIRLAKPLVELLGSPIELERHKRSLSSPRGRRAIEKLDLLSPTLTPALFDSVFHAILADPTRETFDAFCRELLGIEPSPERLEALWHALDRRSRHGEEQHWPEAAAKGGDLFPRWLAKAVVKGGKRIERSEIMCAFRPS